jgi:acyl-coenzyme A thioesterase PaaI-like protein
MRPEMARGRPRARPIIAFLGVHPISPSEGEARVELTATERLHTAM